MTTTAEKIWRQPLFMAHDVLCCTDRIRWIVQQYKPEDREEFFHQLRQEIITLEKDLQP